ncbi:MAG: biotin transporter BioY [Gemmatimonadales bacterium]
MTPPTRASVQHQRPSQAHVAGTPGAPARASGLQWPLAVVSGAVIVALSAQVAVPLPLSPVPLTLQGLAVVLVGGLFGAAAGAGAMVLYLVAGAFGAPVFALGASGLPRLLGLTGGYLLAFPLAAIVTARLAVRGQLIRSILAAAAGTLAIHLGGWAQLTLLTGNAERAVTIGVIPFLVPDGMKVLLAGIILWKGHHLLRPRA